MLIKVDVKSFEPIQYETAMRRIAIGKETYIKYIGNYSECKIKEDLERICMYNNDKCYIGQISFVKALDYKFYVLM